MDEQKNEWRRIAVKPRTGKQLDILLALANVNRPVNAKLTLYEYVASLVRERWSLAKVNGQVHDGMLGLDEPENESPVYVPAEQGA